jgi:hypothetical protein
MRLVAVRIILFSLASGAACTTTPPQPPEVSSDGTLHYKTSRTAQQINCDGRPIELEGDRSELTLSGACRFVRISGSHNDISLDVVPAGTIEVTGGHNDVSWRQTGAGPRPNFQDHGDSNSFHQVASNP